MKKFFAFALLALAVSAFFVGCKNASDSDEPKPKETIVTEGLNLPNNQDVVTYGFDLSGIKVRYAKESQSDAKQELDRCIDNCPLGVLIGFNGKNETWVLIDKNHQDVQSGDDRLIWTADIWEEPRVVLSDLVCVSAPSVIPIKRESQVPSFAKLKTQKNIIQNQNER